MYNVCVVEPQYKQTTDKNIKMLLRYVKGLLQYI